MSKSEKIYNSGEIVFRNNECFWIFPVEHITNPSYFAYSPWFWCKGAKWRLIIPLTTKSDYGIITVRLWRKVQSSHLNDKYALQLSLKTTCENRVIKSKTGDIDSDYGCEVELCQYRDIRYQNFCQNGLVKLFFNIERKPSINSVRRMSDEESNEDEASDEDEESGEDEKNSNDGESNEDEENSENEDDENEESDEDDDDDEIKYKVAEKNKKKHVTSDASDFKGIKILAQNLKQVLLDEQMCDAVLKVGDREFNVHKLILVARSPVFASMFQHDLAEKNTNVVNIPDCTAESFEVFLQYLYSGSADTVSTENVYNLYYAADKYRIDDLKELCVEFMKGQLSKETICDIIALSLRHEEGVLLKVATRFFCKNAKKIVKTVQWQNYMAENSTQANELIVKALNS